MRSIGIAIAGLIIGSFAVGRASAQVVAALHGRVTDAITSAPVPGASVLVLVGDTTIGTATDQDGQFSFSALPPGLHRVRVTHVGYRVSEVDEVWVRPGRVEQVELVLHPQVRELGEVEVRTDAPQRMTPAGSYTITVEQVLRYPATFFDPIRLAATQAGIATINDQANHVNVRGNGPAANAWLVEGAEIVTPNHLTNAGTPSDLPTLTGGGTTLLSAQLLGATRVMVGGPSVGYGNALGALFDMGLRRPSSQRHGFTAQAGLLGIDLSAEGPFLNARKPTFLINYRYSTLGLLSAMGVDLGDEAITFQDISFHLVFPLTPRAELRFFGMRGSSRNEAFAKDSTLWELDKDSLDITYSGSVGVAGLVYEQRLGERLRWRSVVALSAQEQRRWQRSPGITGFSFTMDSTLNEHKYTVRSELNGGWGVRTGWTIGMSAMERGVERRLGAHEQVVGWLLRPYAGFTHALADALDVEAGIAYAFWSYNGSDAIEPWLRFNWRPGERHRSCISVGRRSQLPNQAVFPLRTDDPAVDNKGIGLTLANEAMLSHLIAFAPHLSLRAELFGQWLSGVPVAVAMGGASLVNAWDEQVPLALRQQGRSFHRGVEVVFDHRFHRGRYYQMNMGWSRSTFTDANGREWEGRWSQAPIANLLVGHEFVRQRERFERTWGVNLRAGFVGGQRYAPLQEVPTAEAAPFAERYPAAFRTDVRIYLRRAHARRTGMWALDLLNATNARNVAYRYFDQRSATVVTRYQLGLIPNLSYRIEF